MDIKGKRFLLTGGASLVGSHLSDQLLAAGAAEVVLFDNLSFGAPEAIAHLKDEPRVRLVRGDVTRLHELLAALRGIDGAYALAALMTLPTSQDPWTAIDVNIRGVQNLLEAARQQGVAKVVLASSSAVYGYGPGLVGDIVEDTPFHSAGAPPAAVIYGATKIIAEQLCRDAYRKHGLDYLALRFSTVYGERQHFRAANALYIIETYERIRRGERPVIYGDGSETKDYVYVGDLARAAVLAMASDLSDVALNISGGQEISLKALVELILRLSGSPLEPEYREPPAGVVRLSGGGAFRYDREQARELLGWAPQVPLAEGIRRLIAWREEGRRG